MVFSVNCKLNSKHFLTFLHLEDSISLSCIQFKYEGKSISKLQIVIEKKRMGIMTYDYPD